MEVFDELSDGIKPGPTQFTHVELDSARDREGALYAVRMVIGQRSHSRLLRWGTVRDYDLLDLMGLEHDDRNRDVDARDLREAIVEQLTRLERNTRPGKDLLGRNIDKLGDALKLGAVERSVLRLAVIASSVANFGDLFVLCVRTSAELTRAIHYATGMPLAGVSKALSDKQVLRCSGFFSAPRFSWSDGNPLELDSAVVDALLGQRFDVVTFLRRLIRSSPTPSLTLDDFSHLPDLGLVQRYLGEAVKQRRRGVNLLIYGAPGTGKTEFVRAIAAAMKMSLNEVPNEDPDGDPISGTRRFRCYAMCQRLVANKKNQALLFDEIEDVFGQDDSIRAMLAGFSGPGRHGAENSRKSWVNETLESNPVPAFWVCNSIGAIDPAYLRRFDLIVEFRPQSRAIRRRVIDRYFGPGEISIACADRLSDIARLPPAQVERAARVVRALRSKDVSKRDAETERVISTSLHAMGLGTVGAAPALPQHYDPAFLNTDQDLQKIAEGLRRRGSGRLCLYGPPGTGKTAFAHHLGRTLDRAVVVKRGSDLLSMWVGGTEVAIAQAFEQAHDEDAILLLDEADSFLQDRAGAHHSWQITQVNELLTQMEAFNGIFVASTNLIDTLDEASLRRFDFKLKFDFLTRPQRRAMLLRVLSGMEADTDAIRIATARLDQLDHVTAGDFANVLRQVDITGATPGAVHLVGLLAAEVAMKPDMRKRAIGFRTGS